jgi:hypothetical protein
VEGLVAGERLGMGCEVAPADEVDQQELQWLGGP